MSSQQRHLDKINHVLLAIKAQNWSVNKFLIAFYTSEDNRIRAQACHNLTFEDGTRYGPKLILDAWLANTPKDSRSRMEMALTQKVAGIVVEESTKAYGHPDLHRPSTQAKTDDFRSDFSFTSMAAIYQSFMPCLWAILTALVMAENNYKRWQGRTKVANELRASKVSLALSSRFWLSIRDVFLCRLPLLLSACSCLAAIGQQTSFRSSSACFYRAQVRVGEFSMSAIRWGSQ